MLGCVVRVTEKGDEGRLLGCNFIRELSEPEMRGLIPGTQA